MIVDELRPKRGDGDVSRLRHPDRDPIGVRLPLHQESQIQCGFNTAMATDPVSRTGLGAIGLALMVDEGEHEAVVLNQLPEVRHDTGHL